MPTENKIVTKEQLGKISGTNVYEFLKHIPENAKKWTKGELDKNESKYLGTYAFKHSGLERLAYIAVFDTAMELRAYYSPKSNNGFMYNLDWNDSLFLDWCKLTGEPRTILEAVALLVEHGYEYTGELGFKPTAPTEIETKPILQKADKGGQANLF